MMNGRHLRLVEPPTAFLPDRQPHHVATEDITWDRDMVSLHVWTSGRCLKHAYRGCILQTYAILVVHHHAAMRCERT